MDEPRTASELASIESGLRDRRLWYHAIDLPHGLSTRFSDDYKVNPVLQRIDESCAKILAKMDAILPASLSGQSVLDVGCADGKFAFWAAMRGASNVVGVERNKYNCDHAQYVRDSFSMDNVKLHCGIVEGYDSSQTFDVVFCLGLIYHLLNPLGTLHELRRRCIGTLFLTCALDLSEGDGEPLSRLDRYATGAHGMWSFNAAMVRQLASTAGFEIVDEDIEENSAGGRHYFAHAKPGDFSEHHIFHETIDQEFPINVDRRLERVSAVWRDLGTWVDKPVAILGAGTHTPWLIEQMQGEERPEVCCVLDDRVSPGQKIAGLPVIKPTELDPKSVSAVVVSSWHQSDVLRQRAEEVFGDRVKIISLDS